jgi:membrane dipeptidase
MFLNSLFLAPHDTSKERDALEQRQQRWSQLNAQERRQLLADRAAQEARQPFQQATFDTYMQAMLHSIRVMGVDHVGLGAGLGWRRRRARHGGCEPAPPHHRAPAPRGLCRADIAKIMGGNLMRVMRAAEAPRQALTLSRPL